MVAITLNGKPRSVPRDQTLSELLEDLGLLDRLVVVERNAAIVPRGTYSGVVLGEGDVLEIVHFVGGG